MRTSKLKIRFFFFVTCYYASKFDLPSQALSTLEANISELESKISSLGQRPSLSLSEIGRQLSQDERALQASQAARDSAQRTLAGAEEKEAGARRAVDEVNMKIRAWESELEGEANRKSIVKINACDNDLLTSQC